MNLVRAGTPFPAVRQFTPYEPLVLGNQDVVLGYDVNGQELVRDPDTGAIRPRRPMMAQRRPGPAPVPPLPTQQLPQQQPPTPQRTIGLGPAAKVQVTSTGESRSGLTLLSANTAGNVAITAFAGQTTAQHPFMCVAFRVRLGWANDPAAVNDSRVYAVSTIPPQINGLAKNDGQLLLTPNKPEKLFILAAPEQIIQSSTLSPGAWTLVGGTGPMFWTIAVDYLTDLDLRAMGASE